MIWNACFTLSVAVLLFFAAYALAATRNYKSGRILTPFYALFAGTFLAVFLGLIPVFMGMVEKGPTFLLKLVFVDALQTMQVFTVNVAAEFILENISSTTADIGNLYSSYMACLFFTAPLLTFGFLASLFKNAVSGLLYRMHFLKDVYVFSELNEKALLLARSIRKAHPKALLVFTNIDRDESEISSELIESAKELSSLIFPKDIISTDFSFHSKKHSITFFVISENEGENLIQTLKLLSIYQNRDHTQLYVFSPTMEGELLLSDAPKNKIKLRRVSEIRSLVYHYLYNDGQELFENACREADRKGEIHALIVGMGRYGTEMMKALSWYGQMDGYTLNLYGVDQDPLAEEKFAALCPELMSEKYNGVSIPGESQYTIRIFSGTNIATRRFSDLIRSLPQLTYVFVALGDDEDNINCAANIRMLCERTGSKPLIRTVVYSHEESRALCGVRNYRGQAYDIRSIGDLEDTYSEKILLGSDLEKLALDRHLKWGKEEEFWQYEYNYRSSMASAIHMQARIACAVPGAGKAEDSLSEAERDIIERLEHRRWNTYMRSEGYVYSGSPDKSSRNDLAKIHHDLVDFDLLSEEDKRKDSQVGSL